MIRFSAILLLTLLLFVPAVHAQDDPLLEKRPCGSPVVN